MSRLRVYIKPFDEAGNYVSDFIEVTDDVDASSISSIKRSIDSTDYDAGIFKFSQLKIVLNNEDGKYADVNVFQSIFRTKRLDSIVKVTWNPNTDDAPLAGQYILVGDDITIFEGLLSDEATSLRVRDQKISFNCLGYESVLKRMAVPYGSISSGDTFDEIILACLDQTPFNSLVTVSASNIASGTNATTDSVSPLQNKTVKEALDEILIMANAVLYVENNIVYVTDRDESATLQYTFYGQASNNGIENILDISGYKNGLNRVLNYWTWKDSTNLSQDATSVATNGVRKREIESDLITTSGTKDAILSTLKDEFKNPKIEMDLTTPFNYTSAQLKILDNVRVDYPTVLIPADEGNIPIWGQSVWGAFRWPLGIWSLTISTTTDFKIIGISHNLKSGTTTYKLREV